MSAKLEVLKHNEKTEIAITGGRLVAEMFEGEEHRAETIVNRYNLHDELADKLQDILKYHSMTFSSQLRSDIRELLNRAKGGES